MVSRCIKLVSRLITDHIAVTSIKFPSTREERLLVKEGFYNKWGFRGIIGAIDGTHVEIVQPPVTDREHQPHLYINRKGRFSINVMLVCVSDCKILALNARYPGSVHDAAIWHTSTLRRDIIAKYEEGDTHSFLIGDSGYGKEPWLFTPYNNPADGTPEDRYNILHRRTRNVVEKTNGVLKARFRCLSKFRMLQYHPVNAAYIIYVCAALHNISLNDGIINENDLEINNAPLHNAVPIAIDEITNRGREARNNYIRNNEI